MNAELFAKMLLNTCLEAGVTQDTLLGKSKKMEVVMFRDILIYLLKENLFISLDELGRIFNRHRATIMHSIDMVNDYKNTYWHYQFTRMEIQFLQVLNKFSNNEKF